MSGIRPDVDPDGLLEYSVVFTDRSLNHMSKPFQGVMLDISETLKRVYSANSVVVVPGGGTFGMEAVARQFATGEKCLVLRNGWFSFRWTQIFETGEIPSSCAVLKARPSDDSEAPSYSPAPIDEVVETIRREKPKMVFAPHVETSSGMILPENYMRAVGDAIHDVDGLFVLDCIASGAIWVDMEAIGVDILVSAPQKGWSASPCAALVMMSQRARDAINVTKSTSFACDLRRWLSIMEAYEGGGHAYHATMPTDALVKFCEAMKETEAYGFEVVRADQQELGDKMRAMLERNGFRSVAADGFKAPGVIVSYTDAADMQSGARFAAEGLQIAAGVPLEIGEGEEFRTFRVGLFGLDKLKNIERTVSNFEEALKSILVETNVR
ncbi:MAG: 2-aminoethylphosphonate--pyruvate transaminase [Alphaproteobacteria bacterium MarineAlpha4_Bin2]|nr:MAG: 2-aminoethylphosphonate--pyruvate transaminase [Alphaproteobacteria bacterium MarineAlpha4_Bin2]